MDQRAIACFDGALLDVGLSGGAVASGVARLLRLGHHDHPGPVPRIGRRCPRRPPHPEVVLDRAAALGLHRPEQAPWASELGVVAMALAGLAWLVLVLGLRWPARTRSVVVVPSLATLVVAGVGWAARTAP